MKTLAIRFSVLSALALGAAFGCSSKVHDKGSETNWQGPHDAATNADTGGPSTSRSFSTAFTDSGTCTGAECPSLRGFCQPKLPADTECIVGVARVSTACNCQDDGLAELAPSDKDTVLRTLREQGLCDATGQPECATLCPCGLPRLGAECQTAPTLPESVHGYCIADLSDPRVTNLGKACFDPNGSLVRIVDSIHTDGIMRLYSVACASKTAPSQVPSANGALGDPCLTAEDLDPEFNGHHGEHEVETGSAQCQSRVCLVNQFYGRVSCTYGQPTDKQLCETSGPNPVPITVGVAPQKIERPANLAQFCSCRCDGPDPSAHYCQCPNGFECSPAIPDYGFAGSESTVGSYCIPAGSAPSGDVGSSENCTYPATPRDQAGCGPE